MTTEEFDIWFKAHRLAFPELGDWLRSSDDAAGVIAMWRELLSGVSLKTAQGVTRGMMNGELEYLDRWSCSKLPRVILSHAPKRLPTADEVNDPKTGWTPYRGMGR